MMSVIRFFATLFSVLLLFSCGLIAQSKHGASPGKLVGNIVDMYRAAVVITHESEQDEILKAKVDSRGHFEISLAPGYYDVLVAADGFRPACKRVWIQSDQTISFSPHLNINEETMQH